MPYFLSDPTTTTYLLFLSIAIVTIAVFYTRRTRKSLIAAGIGVFLFALLCLCDYFFESPREKAVLRVQLMAEDATTPDPDHFIEHLSPTFRYKGADREAIRRAPAWEQVRRHQVRVAVWGFAHDDTEYRGDQEVEIGFYGKVQTMRNEALLRYIRMTFVRDSDGDYRVKTMQFFATGGFNVRTPEDIPGFP